MWYFLKCYVHWNKSKEPELQSWIKILVVILKVKICYYLMRNMSHVTIENSKNGIYIEEHKPNGKHEKISQS